MIENENLVIRLPLLATPRASGNVKTELEVQGRAVTVGANAYISRA